MNGQSDAASTGITRFESQKYQLQALGPVAEVNERCIDLLVQSSRLDATRAPFLLALRLRPLLQNLRPAVRRRAAEQRPLLVDIAFRDHEWWQAVKNDPARCCKHPIASPPALKRAAVQLARATMILAWHGLRTDPDAACVLFGMSRSVGTIISTLQFAEIEQIAERQFRHARPRWEDRPWVWRKLLIAAQAKNGQAMRDFNIHALQLLAGESLPTSL